MWRALKNLYYDYKVWCISVRFSRVLHDYACDREGRARR